MDRIYFFYLSALCVWIRQLVIETVVIKRDLNASFLVRKKLTDYDVRKKTRIHLTIPGIKRLRFLWVVGEWTRQFVYNERRNKEDQGSEKRSPGSIWFGAMTVERTIFCYQWRCPLIETKLQALGIKIVLYYTSCSRTERTAYIIKYKTNTRLWTFCYFTISDALRGNVWI